MIELIEKQQQKHYYSIQYEDNYTFIVGLLQSNDQLNEVYDILYEEYFEVEFYSERLINYEEFCAVRIKGKYSSEEIYELLENTEMKAVSHKELQLILRK